MSKEKIFITRNDKKEIENAFSYGVYQKAQEFDYFFKMRIIGASGVGKSCLLLRYADDTYTESYISTIGVDFKIRTLEVKNKTVKNQIYDTSGQNSFRYMCQNDNFGAHAYIVAFDLTDTESFKNVPKWIDEVERFGVDNPLIILVGTKSDLVDKRTVLDPEINNLMDKHGINAYIATSAKNGDNVDNVFEIAYKQILENMDKKNNKNHRQKLIDDLDRYITRISDQKTKNGRINFSYGFWFCSTSRAINREANYLLAKQLKQDLQNTKLSLRSIFSVADIARDNIIGNKGLFKKEGYVKRGINSSELNEIIKCALK